MEEKNPNWKRNTYFIGALTGLAIGVLSAYLFARAAKENHGEEGPPAIGTLNLIGLTLTLIGVVRQIAELGSKK